MTWSANRYQKLPPVSLKREGILTCGVALKLRDTILTLVKSLTGVVRQVPNDSQMVCTAKSIGICLGQ
jgi:hypothetical protein